MSAKVADILESNDIAESLNSKRGRRSKSKYLSTSGRSSDNTRRNQGVIRRSSRCQNRSLKEDSPPKELKLFPIFISRSTNESNSKEIIKAFKSNDTVCADDKRHELDMPQTDNMDNVDTNLPAKALKKIPKSRKHTRLKTSKVASSDCDGDKLIKLKCNTNDSKLKTLKSENTETAVFSDPKNSEPEICEIVNDICLKTEQALDCDDVIALTHDEPNLSDSLTSSLNSENNLKPNDSDKFYRLSQRKRKGQIKSVENDESDKTVDDKKDMPEISVRRKSLRNSSNRNNCINYSEIDIDCKQGQKRKSKKSLVKYSDNHDSECVILDTGANEYSKNSIDSSKTNYSKGNKCGNVKEKAKFFPIFTSGKGISNDSFGKCSLSTKRKALNAEIHVENEGNSVNSQNKKYSAKRVRKESNIDKYGVLEQVSSVEHNHFVCDSEKNLNKKCKSLPLVINSKILKNTDCNKKSLEDGKLESENIIESNASRDSDKPLISQSDCIDLSDDQCMSESYKLGNASSKVSSYKKVYNACPENTPFPILSHLNVNSESLSDTVSKFLIKDEVSNCDIVLPVWDEVMGLTDAHCIQETIKIKGQFDLEKKDINDCSYLPSDKTIDENNENMLWTDALQNTIIKEKNNEAAVNEIKSWLLQWKNKFCKTSKIKKNDRDSDSFSSGSDSDDDFVSNSIIISGAPGSGKTSLVFSLANELGFKVIEVNASSSRNGRNISHQLKEALESYHVESIKIENPFKINVIGAKIEKVNELEILDTEVRKNKNIKSFFEPKHQKVSNSDKKKVSIATFFQSNNSEANLITTKPKTRNKRFDKAKLKKTGDENYCVSEEDDSLKSEKNSCKISSLTIILFDDVDIVFEEDEGFWSTVKGFLKISKKPVIFTVSRNLSIVKTMLNSDIKVFSMKSSSKESALKKIETCCKTYLREDTNTDVELLSSYNVNDLRRNILNAQFWTKCPKRLKDDKGFDIDNCNTYLSKSIHFNSFIIGELNFSTDHFRKLLQYHVPYYFLNAVSQYQSLGYDVLYNNLFNILNVLDFTKCKKVWQTVSHLKSSSSNSKNFSDAQMWEEACEIFKLKKLALQNGSSSQELSTIADAVENFSFADTLKGASCNKFQWISMSERIKMWTAGLPICSDHGMQSYEDILQIVSFIHIYILKKIQSTGHLKSGSNESKRLILEHPFLHFDQEFAYKTEEDLKSLSAALPPAQQLNKMALTLDYLSMIKIMCQEEEHRQLNSGKRSGRFLHYFDSISFLLDKTNILST